MHAILLDEMRASRGRELHWRGGSGDERQRRVVALEQVVDEDVAGVRDRGTPLHDKLLLKPSCARN